MSWLLWREYRLNRWILITGAVAICISSALGSLLVSFEIDDEELNAIGPALVLVGSFLTVALLGGNALAGERADRSEEFINYLPVKRSHRLASKLLLHAIVACVLIAVNLRMFGHLLGDLLPVATFAGGVCIALMIYCVNWLVSSLQSSPAMATISGFAMVVLLVLGGIKLGWSPTMIWLSIVTASIACFGVGTWIYLRGTNS
jgi:ABC-type transport system involved in multi-copper enzyme maturation permease subunit